MISGDYASSSSEGDEPEVEVEQETAQLDNDSSDISSALSSPPLPDSTVAFDETELLEYEIIVDGEVVGTTHMTPAAARVAMPGSLPLNNNAPTAARTIGSTATSRPCAPSECATCSATAPRYRCPGCSTMSCSLACVSTHKQQSGCTGKRPRSTYVPLHSFTANQLQHDLFFLEEVARNTHNTKRHPLLPHGSSHRNTHGRGGGGAEGEDEDGQAEGVGAFTVRDVSGRYVALQRACVRLGIKLMVMPTGMRRHSINSSVWNAREGRLCWHVEWLLDSDKVSMHQSHVDGSSTWREALVNLLTQRDRSTQRRERRKAHRSQHNPHGGEQQADEERKEAEEEKEGTETVTAVSGGDSQRVVAHHSDPKMRHQLQQYADALDSLTLHLRVPMTAVGYIAHKTVSSCLPHAPRKEAYYYALPLSSQINTSLKGLTVIEFPSVHVVFPANVSEYPPYQPRPLSNNKQQSRAAPQLQPATTHGATPADVETARPAAATTPMLSSVPHMHPDRLVRSAQYGASEREGDVTTSSEAGVVRRWQ